MGTTWGCIYIICGGKDVMNFKMDTRMKQKYTKTRDKNRGKYRVSGNN